MTENDIRIKLRLNSPAIFAGSEFEADLELRNTNLLRTDAETAERIGLTPGVTASVRCRIVYDDCASGIDYITVYITGKNLPEFICKYGTSDINAVIKIKAELIYTVYREFDYEKNEHLPKEIIGCRLLDIISDEHLDEDII